MSKWQKLDVTNLPSDILVGDYEFEWLTTSKEWEEDPDSGNNARAILSATGFGFKYRYRKKQPNAPTHEEIMTKWWRNKCGSWFRVNKYYPNYGANGAYGAGNRNEQREWFANLESADIPPEAQNE